MFRDSKGMSGAQLNEITGKMGGDNNAFTTNDATQFYFVAPAAYLDLLLHIEAARMRGAELGHKDWTLEKGAIEQEVSVTFPIPASWPSNRPRTSCTRAPAMRTTRWARAPRSTRPPRRRFSAFYDAWYQPNNAIFVIVGDVDPQLHWIR